MNSKQGLILVICAMILAGEVASFPTDVQAKTSFTEDDAIALEQQDINYEVILKKIPHFIVRLMKRILGCILKKKDPLKILLSVIKKMEKAHNKKDKKNKKKKENDEEEESKPEI